jgi:hypothetical protein
MLNNDSFFPFLSILKFQPLFQFTYKKLKLPLHYNLNIIKNLKKEIEKELLWLLHI